MRNGVVFFAATLASLMLFLLPGCGGQNGQITSRPEVVAGHVAPPGEWLHSLPVDALQPWEVVDDNGHVVPVDQHSASALNLESEFVPGVERYRDGGNAEDKGEACTLSSTEEESSYALYRIPLGGEQPGVVTVDANVVSGSGYYVGLADYGSSAWQWHGPFTDNHVRIATVQPGSVFTSTLGNVFVSVGVSGGTVCDVVGVGVNATDAADTTAPPAPAGVTLEAVSGGLLLDWLPVVAGDLAGYRVYYNSQWFFDGRGTGVKVDPSLEGRTSKVLTGLTTETFVRIAAVDVSGNESPLSDVIEAVPLAGEPPPLTLSVGAPSCGLNELVAVNASGAETYDWDVDGDGTYEITGDSTGAAAVDTSRTGILRPAVRGIGSDGTSLALGGVSLIVSGNARPVASGSADPSYGMAPLTVSFAGSGEDFDGEIVLYSWDFDGDGTYDWSDASSASPPDQIFSEPYLYNCKFRVDDDLGAYDVDTVSVQIIANQPPIAQLQADKTAGDAPFTVHFDASASVDLDGSIASFEWDWEGDDVYDEDTGTTAIASHYYEEPSEYVAHVRVTDDLGAVDIAFILITARGSIVVTPDESPGAGFGTSLAVVNGHPAIAYRVVSAHELRYVQADDASGLLWNPPVTLDSNGNAGLRCSLAIVDGRPAVCYFVGDPSYDLRYVRANDADGSSWGAPVTPDSDGEAGLYASLAVVDGNPAISYYDGTTNELNYVRASDSAGAAWNAPQTVDSNGFTGLDTSLAVVDGNPAISYIGGSAEFDLRYVRADDASGTSWGTPVTVDGVGSSDSETSLAVVLGRPAISYRDSSSIVLKYVRASDNTGQSWDPPVVADSSYNSGRFASLAIIRGRPAIGYYSDGYSKPRYVRATDLAGSIWNKPKTVDEFVLGGAYISITEVTGYAALSYSDPGLGILKYALIIE